VVNISTEHIVTRSVDPFFGLRDRFVDPFFQDFFGRFGHQERIQTQSLGSGVIVDADGFVVTNEHVVRKASKIHIALADKTALEAELVSADPENDIAVLRIPASPKLKVAPMGSSSDLMIGETAIALGNPFGLENSVSVGVLSAKNRSILADGKVLYADLLQTDAAINPGNSGGPLLNIHGEVIGINTAIYGEGQGIGFAIPVDRIKSILESLLDYRVLKGNWLGLQIQALTPEMGRSLGVTGQGVIVTEVEKNSPAAKANLAVGDLVRRVDGQAVTTVLDFNKAVLRREKGDALAFDVLRGGNALTPKVILEAAPALSPEEVIRKRVGFQVQVLNRLLAQRLGLRIQSGLLITDVDRNGPASEAGLQQMDVIVQIGRYRITQVEELGRLLARLDAGASVPLLVVRGEVLGRTVVKTR
jgi:serine protease Do